MTVVCEVAADVSATLRGLLLHKTDPPFVLLEFNPWTKPVRVTEESPRAWADGSWSGAEWQDAVTVPIRVLAYVGDSQPGTRRWLALQQQLAQAFAASQVDLPLDFTVDDPDEPSGAQAYVIFGRPRLVDPLAATALRGWAVAACQFRALDPLIYSGGPGGLHTATIRLPVSIGGLIVPFVVPFVIDATVQAGRANLTNQGTVATGLHLRIDGPVQEPSVTLQTSAGARTLRFHDTLAVGQWLELDTRAHTALLNGVVSRRGQVSGDWFLLEPGTWELSFGAAAFDPDALLTATWRDAWL